MTITKSNYAFPCSPPSLAPSPQWGAGQSASPGPENRIRTRPRFPEICLKLNAFLSRTFKAPNSGSYLKSLIILNSFLDIVFGDAWAAVSTRSATIFKPLSLRRLKVPRLGVCLAGTLTAGSLFFGTAKDAVADPGDRIDSRPFSAYTSDPGGADFDNLDNLLYYIENTDNTVKKS